MDFATALIELNILIGDTDNFTFTVDQKTQFLTTAWNDSWVTTSVWDSSLTYSVGTAMYTLPDEVSVVADVYTQRSSTDYPEPIDNNLWEVANVDGELMLSFLAKARYALDATYPILLKGRYKLQTTDLLPTELLQNYVLSNAAYVSLRSLGYQFTLRFLRNDTSLSDIINLRRDMQADMLMYRSQIQREYESS